MICDMCRPPSSDFLLPVGCLPRICDAIEYHIVRLVDLSFQVNIKILSSTVKGGKWHTNVRRIDVF